MGCVRSVVLCEAAESFRLLYAVVQYLNFFSAIYTGRKLTSGGAKGREMDLKQMMIWGNVVQAQRAQERSAEEEIADLGPKSWELCRRGPDGRFRLSQAVPVFVLGFPFGDALATNQGNPSITIGKGSVSSIRKNASGKTAKIQIDGGACLGRCPPHRRRLGSQQRTCADWWSDRDGIDRSGTQCTGHFANDEAAQVARLAVKNNNKLRVVPGRLGKSVIHAKAKGTRVFRFGARGEDQCTRLKIYGKTRRSNDGPFHFGSQHLLHHVDDSFYLLFNAHYETINYLMQKNVVGSTVNPTLELRMQEVGFTTPPA